jgi:branched-chain amino acid transport system ATP-binding protein
LHQHWDLSIVLLLGGLAGGVAAVLVGLPAIRVQGLYLAVTTLAFAGVTGSWLLNSTIMSWVPDPTEFLARDAVFGRFEITSERSYYYVCVVVLALALVMVRGVKNSRTGRVLIATRDNERAAQSYGINPVRARLTVFGMSGFLAGVAGGLYVFSQQALGTAPFAPAQSLKVFTMVVIGGMGSIPGALVGSLYLNGTAWFVDLIPNLAVRTAVGYLGTGVGVVIILLVLPGGLGSLLYRIRDRLLRLVADRDGIVVPSLVADSATRAPDSHDPNEPAPRPVDDGPGSVLRVRDLEVGYDGVQVLFGVDLDLGEAEIIALLGTNGAGKSTVLRGISRLTRPSAGVVTFEGQDLADLRPDQVTARGLGQVPGGRGVFPSLSVADNLRMATWMRRHDRAACAEVTADAVAMFPVLKEKLNVLAGDLSGGQQQMLTLAQTFMTGPKVIMIDELSLGLAPVIVEELIAAVNAMRDRGVSVILVEQSVNIALTVADRAYFMEKGEVRFHGPTAELLDRPDILRSVFIEGAVAAGEAARAKSSTSVEPRIRDRSDDVVLSVADITCSFGGVRALDGVSFELRQGEILGILGPNGAGKTTLFDVISGFTRADAGSVGLYGLDVSSLAPDRRAMAGLGRSFQDARLFPTLTVASTIALSLERSLPFRDPLAAALNLKEVAALEAVVSARVEELIELLGLAAFRDKFVAELSTGSRRIVDLACILAHRPSVLLLDEPSSGIAQRETEALGPMIHRIQREINCSILVIEHDMPLLTSVSDRLIAMETGRIVAQGDPRDVLEDPRIVESYLGYSSDVINRSGAVTPARKSRPLTSTAGRG